MAYARKLSEDELRQELEGLPGWSVQNSKLHREYKFADFAHAWGFMSACAVLIEKRNHHPEWQNVYGRVIIDLITHDAGAITDKDEELARTMEGMARKLLEVGSEATLP
jgi:4a-hydroxytetrahydrobiopterin dehydratase